MTDAVVRFARLPLSSADRRRALDLVSPAEAERYRRTGSDGFLLGRLLLHDLVAQLTAGPTRITARCVDCGEEHGPPQVDGLFLSVAHADDVAVVAAASTAVGVDIEREDAEVPAEFAADAAGWTRLEAVLKADGRGFRVEPRGASLGLGSTSFDGVDYLLTQVDDVPGYVISVAQAASASSATRRIAARAPLR